MRRYFCFIRLLTHLNATAKILKKNHICNSSLHISKNSCTFAPQTNNNWFADILLKAFALFEDSFNLPHLNFSCSENNAIRSRLYVGFSAYIGYEGCGSPNEPIAVGSRFFVYLYCDSKENQNTNQLKTEKQ